MHIRVITAALENGANGAHEHLKKDNLVVREPGYVYIYLSNESPTSVEVFFDDFKVEHVKSAVVQMDDYYPGGATFNSHKRENSVINKRLYQSKEWQTDLSLNLYDIDARFYDPFIWRTPTIDPHAENYYEWSPYNWAFNNTIRYGDPSGKDPIDKAIGFLAAVIDNGLAGGISPLRNIASNYIDDAEDFNSGQDMGDVFSMFSGIMEAQTGAGLAAGGGTLTVATGGLAGEIGVPAAGVGLGMIAHGTVTTAAGANNFMNQKGRLEARRVEPDYRKTKHTDNRHIDRNKYPEKSKYSKPNQVNKLNEKTIKKPDKVTTQNNGRVVYEKDMKRKIGTGGQTVNKVVVDPRKKKIVTSYPPDPNK